MDGQRSSTPGVVQEVLLMEVADILEELLDVQKSWVPEGKAPQLTVSVGPAVTELTSFNTFPIPMPWKSVTIFNDGPVPVFQSVNSNYLGTVPLNPTEKLTMEMAKGQITKMLLTTGSGGLAASVRLFAVK